MHNYIVMSYRVVIVATNIGNKENHCQIYYRNVRKYKKHITK